MRRLSNVSSNDTSTSGKKFVPWEPSKPSIQNKSLPQLIPYSLPKSSGSNETLDEELISQIRDKRNGVYYQNGFTHSGHQSESNELENKTCNGNVHAESPSSINETLQRELEIEREVNQELKKLLVAALSEDVQCHVQSLAEDKVRLAKKMDKFAYHVSMDAERVNELCIENNIWRCKYLAMGIKADELSYSLHRAVAYLKNGQELIAEVMNKARMTENDIALVHRLNNFLELDPTSLLNKSPCETMYLKKPPLTSNLTILCCKKCAGKEVKLV